MAALMKFDRDQLAQVLQQTEGVVLANDNSEEQVVISGRPTAVDQVIEQVKTKRAVPLKVSGAFHSPFMAEAAEKFQSLLTAVTFHDAQFSVLSNVDPTPTTQADVLRQRLIQQMTGTVRWRETMEIVSSLSCNPFGKVGPAKS